MRPLSLDEVIGQDKALYPGSPLRNIAAGSGRQSILLYSPPGTGKTTIAIALANNTTSNFIQLSAISATVKDIREVIAKARTDLENGQSTILFLDEIHRFTKSQQDILLGAVENGTLSLIGATTENPSFTINKALQSRTVLVQLEELDIDDLVIIIDRAIHDERGLDSQIAVTDEALLTIARSASGDARQALTLLETAATSAIAQNIDKVDEDFVKTIAPSALSFYDRDGNEHYDIISAFIKAMRGSDPQAAIYWMARMLNAGEDPRYVARRIFIHAAEDVGMADPIALLQGQAAMTAAETLGMPECQIPLAQAAIYIATAPKSPAVVDAISKAMKLVRDTGDLPVPKHLRDAHYSGAKALSHGIGYRYPHDYQYGVVAQQYLPNVLGNTQFYQPRPNGNEKVIKDRLKAFGPLGESNLAKGPQSLEEL